VHSPFGLSLSRHPKQPVAALASDRGAYPRQPRRRSRCTTLAAFIRHRRRRCSTQTTALASLDVLLRSQPFGRFDAVLVIGGHRLSLRRMIGAVVSSMLQEVFSTNPPQYWQFCIGLVPGRDRAGRPRPHALARALSG